MQNKEANKKKKNLIRVQHSHALIDLFSWSFRGKPSLKLQSENHLTLNTSSSCTSAAMPHVWPRLLCLLCWLPAFVAFNQVPCEDIRPMWGNVERDCYAKSKSWLSYLYLMNGKTSPYDMSALEVEWCEIVQAVDFSLVYLNKKVLSTCQYNCCL